MRIAALLLLILCPSCATTPPQRVRDQQYREVKVPFDDPNPPFDHAITWRGATYKDGTNAGIEYFLDNKSAGRGYPGFENVLRHFAELPKGSRILIYPRIWAPNEMIDYAPYRFQYPFAVYWDQLEAIGRKRDHWYIFSFRNPSGEIVETELVQRIRRHWEVYGKTPEKPSIN